MDSTLIIYEIKYLFSPRQIENDSRRYSVKDAAPRGQQSAAISYKKNIGEARLDYTRPRIPKKEIVKSPFFCVLAQNPSLLIKSAPLHFRKRTQGCQSS